MISDEYLTRGARMVGRDLKSFAEALMAVEFVELLLVAASIRQGLEAMRLILPLHKT